MNELDLAYTAGIFDGEGSVSLNKKNCWHYASGHSITMVCALSNTDLALINWLQSHFGGSVCLMRNRSPKWRECWRWSVPCNKALAFLVAIYPYLRIKKYQAGIAVDFQKRRCAGHLSRKSKILDEAQRTLVMTRNGRYLNSEPGA